MAKRDYYDILGVSKKATADEIRKAHRKLVLKHHPDRNPGDKKAEEKFKEIQEAYDVLSDDEKRKQYDEFGHAGVGTAGPPGGDPFEAARRRGPAEEAGPASGVPAPASASRISTSTPAILAACFERLFGAEAGGGRPGARGGARAGPQPQRGEDLEHPVTISFDQAARGMTQSLQIDRGGRLETIEVKLPAGVKDGSRIRIKGKGEPGRRRAGRYLHHRPCASAPLFPPRGARYLSRRPLSVYEALLGTKVTVPTLDGRLTVTIPPGTSSGAKLRLKGHGIERAAEKGDQYVVMKVIVPRRA